ncbi:MAG: type II toxin-antitoxin system VapC family toxin [Limisphaerales bacterium]
MKIAIDTNRYVDFMRGDAVVVEQFQLAGKIILPFVVAAELRAGFLVGNRRQQNERGLVQFLNSPRVSIFYPDENSTHHYARIFQQLRKQGTPIPTNDIWIAAIALQHDLILYTRDIHFKNLPQIPQI